VGIFNRTGAKEIVSKPRLLGREDGRGWQIAERITRGDTSVCRYSGSFEDLVSERHMDTDADILAGGHNQMDV
jgi:hypothetical protein